jgi:predicted Zn-dependent protease
MFLLNHPLNSMRIASMSEKVSDQQQFEEADNNSPESARAGVTLSKYRNQMAWR